MGFSITDEESFNREGVLSDYVYYQVKFDRPVEGQVHNIRITLMKGCHTIYLVRQPLYLLREYIILSDF